MSLRPYQIKDLDQIRSEFRQGNKRLLLHAPTGSGKTVSFCEILKGCHEKGTAALMVVRGRKLVDQASERLRREKVDHGVLMSGHWNWAPHRKIQICSVDTLRARKLFPEAKLIVIDEAHLAASQSYKDFLSQYPAETMILGVTATPYVEKDFSHIATKVIKSATVKELIALGHLVPARYFVPYSPNLSGIKINSHDKDYNKAQLSFRMSGAAIVGKVVEHWKILGEDRPSLCFAVTIAHSQEIVRKFNEAGVAAIHCDADSPESERRDAIEKLRSGQIKILSSVNLFSIGVDMPFVSCIVMARPTKSLALYIQICGRGARPCENKKDFLILDHAGNVPEHGPIDQDYVAVLDGKPVRKKIVGVMICKQCFAAFERASTPECPECGYTGKNEKEARKPDEDNSSFLTEMNTETIQKKYQIASHEEILKEIAALDQKVSAYGMKPGFTWHKIKDKYGPDIAKKYLSERFKRSALLTPELVSALNYKIR